MVWRSCISARASVLITLNLSRNRKDHSERIGFDAVNTLMVARKAGESLIGNVVAFCIEKSCRRGLASRSAAPSGARSTEKDNDLTSGLKSEFTLASAFANRTTVGWTPGFAKIAFASRVASAGSYPAVTSNTSNWARAQTPLAWVPRQSDRRCFAAALACIKIDFSTIASISAFSRAGFRSASLSVTACHLVRNTMEVSQKRKWSPASTQIGDELDRGDAWQKAVGGCFRRNKA